MGSSLLDCLQNGQSGHVGLTSTSWSADQHIFIGVEGVVKNRALKSVEVFGFEAFGVNRICEIRNFDFFDVIGVEFGERLKLEVNVLGTFDSFESWDF